MMETRPGSRFSDFLAFAIANEQNAASLYDETAGKVQQRAQKKLLQAMATMERSHEAKLKELVAGRATRLNSADPVPDLRLDDFQVDVRLTPECDLQDVFVFAIKAEKQAFALYSALARLEDDATVRDLLLQLASEERMHARNLETTFETRFIAEN